MKHYQVGNRDIRTDRRRLWGERKERLATRRGTCGDAAAPSPRAEKKVQPDADSNGIRRISHGDEGLNLVIRSMYVCGSVVWKKLKVVAVLKNEN